MGNQESSLEDDNLQPETLSERHLQAVADYMRETDVRNIVVMTGAGISTAAGIPDFRSPGTGLYSNLARLNLPFAQAVFDIEYFQEHPEPFYYLAKELYPGKYHPTISHAFIALLARRGRLLMNFTQNIDCLERRAAVPAHKIIEAHGSFATQRCIRCKEPFPDEDMKEHVLGEIVPRCVRTECDGLVKPDIVFFGEALPSTFRENSHLPAMADLIIVIGTSLSVFPFAGLPEYARPGVPRLLLNRERVGRMGTRGDDVLELGDCDAGVRKLAKLLGWAEELEEMWRDLVGEEEAERQLAQAQVNHTDVEDEVRKLTEEVEHALTLDTRDDEAEGESKGKDSDSVKGEESRKLPEESAHQEGSTSMIARELETGTIPQDLPKAIDVSMSEQSPKADQIPSDAQASVPDKSASNEAAEKAKESDEEDLGRPKQDKPAQEAISSKGETARNDEKRMDTGTECAGN